MSSPPGTRPQRSSASMPLVSGDQLPEHEGQDSALVQVANLRVVVDARVSPERRRFTVIGYGFDIDRLARLDRVDAPDRAPLATGQNQPLPLRTRSQPQRKDDPSPPTRTIDSRKTS